MNDFPVEYSVVIPVYNGARTLRELYARLTTILREREKPYEIIFVEDGGLDNAWPILQDLATKDTRVLAVQLMRNFGQGSATLCGMAHASGQIVVTIDDDLQNPPEEVPLLLELLELDPSIDVVMGVPLAKQHNLFRRLGSRFLNLLNNYFLNKDPNLQFSSFRAIRRPVLVALLSMRVPYPAIGPMLASITRRMKSIVVRHDARSVGRSGYTLGRILRQTISNFIGYSMLPLRMLAVLGAIGIVLSTFLGIYFLIRYMVGGINVPGWASLMLVLVGLSGFNFFAFAVLGEYLLRIFQLQSTTHQFLIRSIAGRKRSLSENSHSLCDSPVSSL